MYILQYFFSFGKLILSLLIKMCSPLEWLWYYIKIGIQCIASLPLRCIRNLAERVMPNVGANGGADRPPNLHATGDKPIEPTDNFSVVNPGQYPVVHDPSGLESFNFSFYEPTGHQAKRKSRHGCLT